MATEMASLNGYAVGQSSSGEIHVGNQVDWMYGMHRIMSFTIEMGDAFAMPDEANPIETARNMEAALYAIEQAGRSRGSGYASPATGYSHAMRLVSARTANWPMPVEVAPE